MSISGFHRIRTSLPGFDRSLVADVIFQLNYTALDGGSAFAASVQALQ
jgi:hypothetical protein